MDDTLRVGDKVRVRETSRKDISSQYHHYIDNQTVGIVNKVDGTTCWVTGFGEYIGGWYGPALQKVSNKPIIVIKR